MTDKIEENFWNAWYKIGGNSGPGSEGELLKFKAEYLNDQFKKFDIKTVFDFGCGDGVLASRLNCQSYLGIDVSSEAIKKCQIIHKPNFHFESRHCSDLSPSIIKSKFSSSLDCCMCIDVLYHVSDFKVVDRILSNLFQSNAKIIILYTIPDERIKKNFENPSACLFSRKLAPILTKFESLYKLVDRTEPRLISAAGFFVYRKI